MKEDWGFKARTVLSVKNGEMVPEDILYLNTVGAFKSVSAPHASSGGESMGDALGMAKR